MPVSNVLLTQWQKCENFCTKNSIMSFFIEKFKYIQTIQKTNIELNFSLKWGQIWIVISKYLFLLCPHKRKIILLLHIFQWNALKQRQFSSKWQVSYSYMKNSKCTEDKWRQIFKAWAPLHKDLAKLWLWEHSQRKSAASAGSGE